MLCYNNKNSTVMFLLLFVVPCATIIQHMPEVAAMMTTRHDDHHHHHHHLRSNYHFGDDHHHHITSMQNNLVKAPPRFLYHPDHETTITRTLRNRTRAYGNDGSCDSSAWAAYRSNIRNVWTDPICYRYDLSLSCLCPAAYTKPLRIQVYNDTVTNVTFLPDPDPSASAYVPEDRSRPTMNRLFAIVNEDCFAGCPDKNGGRAQECIITYDAVHGSIASLYIDYSKLAADDELVSAITKREFSNDFALCSFTANTFLLPSSHTSNACM
jgi:Family of unknown function (DUF6174)